MCSQADEHKQGHSHSLPYHLLNKALGAVADVLQAMGCLGAQIFRGRQRIPHRHHFQKPPSGTRCLADVQLNRWPCHLTGLMLDPVRVL